MKKYILVSQGMKIVEFDCKEEALAIMEKSNEEYYEYTQECADNHEPCADNEIFMYEEEV